MQVGVRELQMHIGRVLDEVTTKRQPVDITRHGRVVARIVPVDVGLTEDELTRTKQLLDELDKLAERVSARWPQGVSAEEAVSRQRR